MDNAFSVNLVELSHELYDRVASFGFAPYFYVTVKERLADAHREADYQYRIYEERLLDAQRAAEFQYYMYRLRAAERVFF